MTAYNSLKAAHLEHRLQTVQASKHTVDALKLVIDDSVHEYSISYIAYKAELPCTHVIPKMGCTALSCRDTLHRVVPLSTACTLAVMLLHSAGVGSAESTATQADNVF
jgi:hypothetical protein